MSVENAVVIFWKIKYSFLLDLYTIYLFQALIANAEQAILSKNLVSLSLRWLITFKFWYLKAKAPCFV